MDIISFICRSRLMQSYYLHKNVDSEYDSLLNKTEIPDRFLKNFYTQVINCTKEDIFELSKEFSNRKKQVSDSAFDTVDRAMLADLFKWISFYHVSRFIAKKGRHLKGKEIEPFMFDIFIFDENEKQRFNHFSGLCRDSTIAFNAEFSDFIVSEIVGFETADDETKAFVNNFLCSTFDGFLKSFTHYVSLNSRLYEADTFVNTH